MGVFANQILNNKPMTIRGDGEQRRDFTYVGDVVNDNLEVGFYEKLKGAHIYNIGSGKNYSVNQIADMLGEDHPKEYIDPVTEPRQTLANSNQFMEYFDWQPEGNLEEWLEEWKEDMRI